MILSNLILAAALVSGGATVPPASAHDWAPLVPYVGVWSSARPESRGGAAVLRRYEPTADNRQLQVTEQAGRNRSLWGVIRFDTEARELVLKRSDAAGRSGPDLFLDVQSSDPTTVVFASRPAGGTPAVERITLERDGWNEFVERVEAAADGKTFSVVSETRFQRKQ
jgi:hypothetical protein